MSRRQNVLLGGLTSASFLVGTAGLALTPFLLTISDELGLDLAAVSALFLFSNLTWALASLTAGNLSDRLGRKPVIIAGMVFLIASCFGTALAQDYWSLALWRLLFGLSGGTQMPTIFAAAADLVPLSQRGKALGSALTGQSMSIVIGTPLCAFIGSFAGWRWSIAAVGGAALALLLTLLFLLPASERPRQRVARREAPVRSLIARPGVAALLAASAFERVCFSTAALFLATYLIATYGMPLNVLSIALVIIAVGSLLGNQVGGSLADRVEHKRVLFCGTMVFNALLALPLLLGAPGAVISIGLGLLYNFANAIGRPTMMWLVSDISSESRGAIMGLNTFMASFGWLTASAGGGWLIVTHGFAGLAWLSAACGLASAALALLSGLFDRRLASQPAPSSPASIAS